MVPIVDKFISKTLVQEFVDLLPQNASILDVCCGTDSLGVLKKLTSLKYHITGIDLSKETLLFFRDHLTFDLPEYQYVKHINFCVQDVRFLGFKAESFDALTAIYAFDYFPSQEFSKVLRVFFDVLTANGLLLVSFGYNPEIYSESHCPEHFFHSTVETMRTAGFSVLSFRSQSVFPYYWILARKNT